MNTRSTTRVKRVVRVAAAVAAAGFAAGALAASPAAADSSTGKYYSITNENLSIRALTGSFSGAVTMSPYTGSNRQHWHWEPANGDGMHLVNKSTGLCLDADPAGQVTTKSCAEVDAQRWLWGHYSSTGGGTERRLRHVPSERVITVSLDQVRVAQPSSFANANQRLKSTFRGQD